MAKMTLQQKFSQLAAERISSTNKVVEDTKTFDFSKFPTMYEYQKAGVKFLSNPKKHRSILADGMGLGKTLQAIGAYYNHDKSGNAKLLIITTKNAKATWRRELFKWLKRDDTCIIESTDGIMGATQKILLNKAPIVVVNFESMANLKDLIMSQPWHFIVVDEAHKLRNRDTKMFKACLEVFRHFQMIPLKLLTGTPLINKPQDLFSLLQCLYPSSFTSESEWIDNHFWVKTMFGEQSYKEVTSKKKANGGTGKLTYTHKNQEEFKKYMSKYMLRRTPEDVLDLPDLMEEIIPIELTGKQLKMYEDIRDLWAAEFDGKESVSITVVIAQIQRLKQISLSLGLMWGESCEGPKTDRIIDILEESDDDEKFVITSSYSTYLKPLAKLLNERGIKTVCLTGASSTEQRTKMENDFQAENSDIKVFLFSTKAGSESITLTAANTIIFTDKPWTAASEDQAVGRIKRIGQNKKMKKIVLEAENTVEQYIQAIIDQKRNMFEESIPVSLVRAMLFGSK